ncbi:fumarylacetoacetate hydrolase family protein [Acuticoccus sp. MNP-M23]|uniref:2-keto-4-pentenoate hydratase n=1 Tax=Acuticoccus sp. MNP-M23 TaxID=3072793 RepID=UPI00281552E3|nr:fumarylacetoacetate hydrolase family protein [Acuticoccus sp. MNP-M23]WMS44095.1 fumarylacetoacetate hydrolase family protein [Acuticoccus sp. MNP-M23]
MQDARQIAPFSGRVEGYGLDTAYAVAAALRRLRGAKEVGRKIGFTNHTIWARYGVDGPMWGDMTETSVTALDETTVDLSPYLEPRLEPEVALCLGAAPMPGMDEAALADCVAWYAPAFEIVQSLFPAWQFTLADCVAAGGLHGRLLLGPPVDAGPYAAEFARLRLELKQDDRPVETGSGANVLGGGPLAALAHLVKGLAARGERGLAAGDIITTGTLTDAQPLKAGTVWSATYHGTPFGTIKARF